MDVYEYDINGNLKIEPLKNQLFYCGGEMKDDTNNGQASSWLRYGTDYSFEYECNLRSLIGKQSIFY